MTKTELTETNSEPDVADKAIRRYTAGIIEKLGRHFLKELGRFQLKVIKK